MCSTSVHISTAMSSSDVHNQCSHIESYVEPDVHNQCSYIDSYVEPRSRQPVFTYRQLCSVPMCTTSVHNIDNFVQPQCAQPVFTNRQLCSAPMCTTSVHISTTMLSPDVYNQCSHNSCTRLYDIFPDTYASLRTTKTQNAHFSKTPHSTVQHQAMYPNYTPPITHTRPCFHELS